MKTTEKFKRWMSENAPSFQVLYENQYVGLAYDHFANLPIKKQKQVIQLTVVGSIAIVVLFILSLYMNLWSYTSYSNQADEMVTLIESYKRQKENQSGEIAFLEGNNRLAATGAFRSHLINQGRLAAISPRMMEIKEQGGIKEIGESDGSGSSIRMKQATVNLQRVNLNQLKQFLENVEYGKNNLSISSMRVTNDDKIRGYMNVELAIVAYLFQANMEG